jgi:hypothetical protein
MICHEDALSPCSFREEDQNKKKWTKKSSCCLKKMKLWELYFSSLNDDTKLMIIYNISDPQKKETKT